MAAKKKTKATNNTKKRLIISYERLPEKDKVLFEEKYEDGLMEHIQTVNKPDGTPIFVVPLETAENIYMVKIDLKIDDKMTDEDFDKAVLHEDKSEQDDITHLMNAEESKMRGSFELNHGDYSSLNSMEEVVAKEDMNAANFTSLDEIDVSEDGSVFDV